MPIDELTRAELKQHCDQLTMVPKQDFNPKQDSSFPAYTIADGHLCMPRWYGTQHFGPAAHDETSLGLPIPDEAAVFAGTLLPHQVEATAAVWDEWLSPKPSPRGGCLVLGCGQGKTVCSLNLVARLKRRTIVLCHKAFLLDQWRERAKTFLPGARLGCVRQAKVDVDADIIFASLQSVAMREYPPELFANCGLLIIDESHHVVAPCLSRALQRLGQRYVLSLSATPERRDGLGLQDAIGPILFRMARPQERVLVTRLVYKNKERLQEMVDRNGKPMFARMLNKITECAERTAICAQHVLRHLQGGRQVIVLSDRIGQLEAFRNAVVALGHSADEAALYIGRCSEKEREAAAEKQLLLSSYAMAREGLDIGRLDTLCLLSPSSSIEQAVGRILRPNAEKKTPLVIDVVDPFSLFFNMSNKRLAFYNKCRYEVQEVAAEWAPDDPRVFR